MVNKASRAKIRENKHRKMCIRDSLKGEQKWESKVITHIHRLEDI